MTDCAAATTKKERRRRRGYLPLFNYENFSYKYLTLRAFWCCCLIFFPYYFFFLLSSFFSFPMDDYASARRGGRWHGHRQAMAARGGGEGLFSYVQFVPHRPKNQRERNVRTESWSWLLMRCRVNHGPQTLSPANFMSDVHCLAD
jgi:hypothetical protein